MLPPLLNRVSVFISFHIMHSWDETTKETENPLKVSNDPDKRYLSLSLESSFNQPQGHM
jgi:hypothetical protein